VSPKITLAAEEMIIVIGNTFVLREATTIEYITA